MFYKKSTKQINFYPFPGDERMVKIIGPKDVAVYQYTDSTGQHGPIIARFSGDYAALIVRLFQVQTIAWFSQDYAAYVVRSFKAKKVDSDVDVDFCIYTPAVLKVVKAINKNCGFDLIEINEEKQLMKMDVYKA